jgi:predicted TIM-barrel fold metal-dependent hydrolase
MPVIDVHTHVFPPNIAAKAMAGLISSGPWTAYYDGTPDGLLAAMDANGIDVSVLCPVATRPDQVISINTWTASLASERFVPFGAMHPDFDGPEDEIDRMVSLGIKGIKLHPEFQEFEPLDPRMERIYRAASRHGLPLLFHAGEDPSFETVRGVPSAFKELADKHPDLPIILAHLGGFRVWDEVAEHIVGRRVYLDTAYTFGHLPAAEVAEIVRNHGTDRILFGTDGPWADPALDLAQLRNLGLSADETEAILWRNAADLIGIEL